MHIQMAGIRNKEDALMCVDCGVDIIGLLVGQAHTSDDFITKEQAREIKLSLPKNIKTTLITHLEKASEIIEIADFIDVDYIQLHSHLPESEVEIIHKALPNKKLLRLIHIDSDGTILNDINQIKFVDFYFTDSINTKTNQVGGTGLVHNINTDKDLVNKLDKPVFIAGGLNPANVAEAVRFCKPYGVDVNSGCRAVDGSRDRQKVIDFVKNANWGEKII
jgi:phosphoribosylanthranilate isomerase